MTPPPTPSAATREGVLNLETLSHATHYNRWLVAQVRPWAGRRILDAGCAIGNITRYWLDRDLVVAVDLHPDLVRAIRTRWGDRPNVVALQGDLADPRLRELARYRFDTVTCFNVLEHVEADGRVLANFHALLQPGGCLLMVVPACRWLYGSLDRAEHHLRRYDRAELRRKAREAGFRILRLHHMNFPGIFGWFVNARIWRRSTLPPRQVAAYNRLIPFVAAAERVLPPPVGQSLVLVAQKP